MGVNRTVKAEFQFVNRIHDCTESRREYLHYFNTGRFKCSFKIKIKLEKNHFRINLWVLEVYFVWKWFKQLYKVSDIQKNNGGPRINEWRGMMNPDASHRSTAWYNQAADIPSLSVACMKMLRMLTEEGKDLSVFERRFIVGPRSAGASVPKMLKWHGNSDTCFRFYDQ